MSYYDERMAEIAAWQAESRQADDLDRLQAGTDAINEGMASPLLWGLVITGLIFMPFTGGLSFALTLWGGVAMSGHPKHIVNAATPHMVDAAAPRAGCARIFFALGSILLILAGIGLFVLLLAYQAGMLAGVQ